MDIRKFGSFVAFMLLTLPIAFAQSTVVSGTIVDPGGNVWANAIVSAQFQPTPNTPGPFTWSGGAFNTQPAPVVADASGIFTITLPSNTAIAPSGSTWQFNVAPNATQQAAVVSVSLSGGTLNLITVINNNNAWPTGAIPGTFINKAYNTSQVGTVPLNVGAMIYNTTTKVLEFWNGSTWAPIGSGGGGTGTVIASTEFEIPFYNTNPSGSSVIGSAALLSAAGDIKTRTHDGTFDAFIMQSAPGANDGIRLALTAANNIVVAGNDYPCTEGSYTSAAPNNYILGIGVPAPFGNGTTLINDRTLCGGRGSYAYNPQMGATGNLLRFDRIVANQWPTGAITTFFLQGDTEFSGSGINSGFTSGGPDSIGQTFRAFELMTRGIYSVDNIEEIAGSQGDNHLIQFQITNQRGSTDTNGEGFNTIRAELNQNLTPMIMLANSTLAAGATLIHGTLNGNVPFPGDGTYLIKSNGATPVFQILSDTPPGSTGTCSLAGQWHVNTTLTADNIGCVAAGQTTVPIQRYGGTTNITVNVAGLTSALSTASTVCLADSIFQESAHVINAGSFSSGTATGVVIAMRYPHQPNFYVAQGSHACNVVEIKANGELGNPPSRQLFRIIGVLPGNIYLYSRTTFGGWDTGLSGYARTYNVANAGATLTRNGSGVVSVSVTDPNRLLGQASITVAGCTNSTFNGVYLVTSDNTSTVTWANPGSATTTTCSKDIEVLSRMNNAFGIRDAQEFPAAEVVNTVDPATFANNQNLTVEPNTNLHVTAGDQLENHPYADVIMGFERNLETFQSQTTPSVAQIARFDQISGFIPEGFTLWRIAMVDSPFGYQGFGGSKVIGANIIDMSDSTVPFAEIFFNLPVPSDTVFTFKGCLYACSDSRAHFNIFGIETNNGFYSTKIDQSTGISEEDLSDFAAGAHSEVKHSASAWVVEADNGVNGFTASGSFGGFQVVVSGPASAVSTLTQTDAGLSYDRTFTLIGTPDGCAQFISGVLGSTSLACGSGGGGIVNIALSLPTSSIAANTCTSPATATMTGVVTTTTFMPTFASDPNAVTGWGATGGLVFTGWPTTNTLNWRVCNQTASPIVPGAMTLNVGAQ